MTSLFLTAQSSIVPGVQQFILVGHSVPFAQCSQRDTQTEREATCRGLLFKVTAIEGEKRGPKMENMLFNENAALIRAE